MMRKSMNDIPSCINAVSTNSQYTLYIIPQTTASTPTLTIELLLRPSKDVALLSKPHSLLPTS